MPAGFREQIVFSGLDSPVDLEFAADGRVVVAEKGGRIKIFDDLADTTPTVFADLSTNVHNQWDRGLLGMALSPDFPADPYVYVLYTYDAPPGQTAPVWNDSCSNVSDGRCVVTGRLSRLRANGNTMTGSEQVLLHDWCQQFPSHSIGGIAFGADGMLYVAGGDGASFNAVDYGQFPSGAPTNPCSDPAGEGGALRSQDIRTSGDPTQLDGTLLRLDPATGAAAAGNPNIGSSDLNTRRIVASGLRNPYRITMRPGTNETWISDTGWNTWEEVNRVVDPTAGVTNFGWPCWEGDARQSGYDSANLPICEALYTAPAGTHTTPFVAWHHSYKLVAGEGCPAGSSSSTGVAFYPTTGGSYPAAYRGAIFFADYSRRCIWASLPSSPGGLPDPANIQTFVSDAASPVDLEVGPGDELYYADLGGGTIRRVRYFPGNQPPTAVIDATPTQGTAPLAVTFNGTGSTDPDHADEGRLRYAWDFTNDGVTDSTSATPTYTYDTGGSYTARLTVTDTLDATDTDTITITPGNERPVAVIDTPVTGTTWKVGDTVQFSGHATDPQQGDLPASSLNWSLVMHHCSAPNNCHEHVIRNWTGVASGSFEAPDHEYPSYMELKAVATDQDGLTHSVTRRLDPKTVDLTFNTVPAGLQLTVGSSSDTAPFTRTVIQGSTNSVSAPSPQGASGFASWSDGGSQAHEITAPTTATTYTATYASVAAQQIGHSQVGATLDSGDVNHMNGSRFVTGSSALSITSMSVYMKGVQAAPNNQYQLAVYADVNSSPGALVAASTPGTVSANSWNTRPITATLAPNTAYWLMYNTNGDNNLSYDAGGTNLSAYSAPLAFGSWPGTFGGATKWNGKFSIYATAGADTSAPTVSSTSPAGDATGVSPNAVVTVRFSEGMDAGTLTPANLELRGPGGTLVNRSVTYDAATHTVTITPSVAMAASTQYTVTVRTGVTDTMGNALAANYPFSFTTGDPGVPRFGYDQVGGTLDHGDMNFMNGSRFVNGASARTVNQVSVYLQTVQAAPANQYQVAIYTDENGSPGTLVASSTSGAVSANSWNSRPVSATLAPNTAYWLMYNTNGENDMSYDTGSANQSAWSVSRPFGTWPGSFGTSSRWAGRFSIYAS